MTKGRKRVHIPEIDWWSKKLQGGMTLIKETIDVIKEAELKGEQLIADAKKQSKLMKEQIVLDAKKYRDESMENAEIQANNKKQQMVEQCDAYEKQKAIEIEEKKEKIKRMADGRMDYAVERVIDALTL